jgi:hypothetical protein
VVFAEAHIVTASLAPDYSPAEVAAKSDSRKRNLRTRTLHRPTDVPTPASETVVYGTFFNFGSWASLQIDNGEFVVLIGVQTPAAMVKCPVDQCLLPVAGR